MLLTGRSDWLRELRVGGSHVLREIHLARTGVQHRDPMGRSIANHAASWLPAVHEVGERLVDGGGVTEELAQDNSVLHGEASTLGEHRRARVSRVTDKNHSSRLPLVPHDLFRWT